MRDIRAESQAEGTERMNSSTEWNRMLHAAHLCIWCKKQDAYTLSGHWKCYDCCQKDNERAKKHNTHAVNQVRWQREKATQAKRRENGVCIRCGHALTDKRYKTCERCRIKAAAKKRARSNHKTIQGLRGKDGRCFRCNELPVEPGFKTCPECHAKLAAQLAINRKGNSSKHPWKMDNNLAFKAKKEEK
jgi:hypothetical protein